MAVAVAPAVVEVRRGRALDVERVAVPFARVRALLDRLGLTPHARYCERVGQPEQRLAPLADIPYDRAPYFALILVRKPVP